MATHKAKEVKGLKATVERMKRTQEKHQREMVEMRAKLKAAEKAAAEKAAAK